MTTEDFDERVVEMLRTLKAEHGKYVCEQLEDANLIGVQNKASGVLSSKECRFAEDCAGKYIGWFKRIASGIELGIMVRRCM